MQENILSLPKLHDEFSRLLQALEKNTKKATLLFCSETEDEGSSIETKIARLNYYLPTNKKWPANSETESLLTPIAQINLSDFEELEQKEKKGLLQIFFDFDYKIKDIVITKNTVGVEIRFLTEFSETKSRKLEIDKDNIFYNGPFKLEKKEFLSLPSARSRYDLSEEHLFMKYNWDKELSTGERIWSSYNYAEGLYIEDKLISRVGGYAPWINDDQTPICPICGNRMKFIFAIGSEDTDFDFGDDGYLMLFSCNFTSKCGGLTNPSIIIQTY